MSKLRIIPVLLGASLNEQDEREDHGGAPTTPYDRTGFAVALKVLRRCHFPQDTVANIKARLKPKSFSILFHIGNGFNQESSYTLWRCP